MVTVKDETLVVPVNIRTLNDIPVGQLFRGTVHFQEATYGGFLHGIFRKYRGPWSDNGVVHDCLVVAQTWTRTVTQGVAPTSVPGSSGHAFLHKCSKVEHYEPLMGVLTVTKA